MRRIPVSLGQILRRYAFSDTQLLCRIVAHEVHGALRAPPDEADLGPARFWAGVHRRERCGPESDGGQLARRLVQGAHAGQSAPATLPPRSRSRRQPLRVARAAVAARANQGSPFAAPARRPRACETNKKALQRFQTARSADFAVPFLCVHVCVLPPEAWATRPDPSRPDLSAAAAAAAPSLGSEGYKQH